MVLMCLGFIVSIVFCLGSVIIPVCCSRRNQCFVRQIFRICYDQRQGRICGEGKGDILRPVRGGCRGDLPPIENLGGNFNLCNWMNVIYRGRGEIKFFTRFTTDGKLPISIICSPIPNISQHNLHLGITVIPSMKETIWHPQWSSYITNPSENFLSRPSNFYPFYLKANVW